MSGGANSTVTRLRVEVIFTRRTFFGRIFLDIFSGFDPETETEQVEVSEIEVVVVLRRVGVRVRESSR